MGCWLNFFWNAAVVSYLIRSLLVIEKCAMFVADSGRSELTCGLGILSLVISLYPCFEFSMERKALLGRSFSRRLKFAFLESVL